MATVNKNRFKTDKNGRVYIVVIAGDTLSEIAEAHFGDWTKYKDLATLNSIDNPDHIRVGQTIYLTKASSSDQPTPSSPTTSSTRPTVTQFGPLASDPNKLVAVWSWGKRTETETFEVEWRAYRGGIWPNEARKDEDVMVDRQNSTYDIPTGGDYTKVQFRVRPVPKKNDEGSYKFDTDLWTNWNDNEYYIVHRPDTPNNLSIELDLLKLTATVTNVDTSKVSLVEFKLVRDGNESTAEIKKAKLGSGIDDTGEASCTFTVLPGSKYKVCCRTKSKTSETYSEWSEYTGSTETQPAKVEIKDPVAKTTESIYLEWGKSETATNYVVACTNHEDGFFEGTDGNGTEYTTEAQNYTFTGLAKGTTYYFRVKAKNASNEESEWSEVKTCSIGSDPTAPTTWSSTTTAIASEDETVALYWVHNSTDGSAQKSAEVTISFDGVTNLALIKEDVTVKPGKISNTSVDGNTVKYTIESSTAESDRYATYSLTIDTKNYDDGAKITWYVCTTGITGRASEKSMSRDVYIYARPSIELSISDSSGKIGTAYYKVDYLAETNEYLRTPETIEMVSGTPVAGKFTTMGEQVRTYTVDDETFYYCVIEDESLKAFPFNVRIEVGANMAIQKPVEYHLTVTPNESYETVDNFGKLKVVTPEEMLYSKHFTAGKESNILSASISAQDVSLSNGQSYTVKCVAAMDSGITVEASKEIYISWSSQSYSLNAEIGLDRDNYSVYLRPYCEIVNTAYYRVYTSGYVYFVDKDTKYSFIYGSVIRGVVTATGEQVYTGTTEDGEVIYYTIVEESTPITDVWLAVYRREYDGTFTEIISGLDASKKSFVTDPHPSLDFARYRITAMDKNTGMISYSDISNFAIGEKAIIIQWNEPYESYEVSEDELSVPNRSETFLRLPYNIDVTTSRDPDVSLIKYIGRKHPVSYYGTQVGEKASWSTSVPKSDTETLYTLQRLQAWTGDVYVREPYGTGYWANVKVAISRSHLETVVPVTLDVIRVEGGI